MQEHLTHYMQVGIVSFMAFPDLGSGEGDVVAAMEKLADHGFFEQVDVTRVADPDARRRAIAVVRSSGMRVGFGAHPIILSEGLNLNAPDEGERRAAIDRLVPFIDEACEWGALAFVVLSGKDPGDADRDRATDALIGSLDELADESRKRGGPPIVLEQFDRVPFGKNCLVGPTPLAAEVARKMRDEHPDFGLLLDLSHLPLLGEDPAAALATAKEYLNYVHVGNCVLKDETHEAYGDNHPPFGIPEGENGVAALRDFLKSLFDVGFLAIDRRPVVGFEIKPTTGWTSDAVLDHARATLEQAWEELTLDR